MLTELDHRAARALLEWQMELGATEAIGDSPVNRYQVDETGVGTLRPEPARAAAAAPQPAAPAARPVETADADPVAMATDASRAAADLKGLAAALAAFEHCELKRGARNTVFADGRPGARVMIIGEAPGREEDLQARPFVGRAGQLLDRMFAAIGLARDAVDLEAALYITNILPWRPPQNREPTAKETAMLLPFVRRHVELAAPEVLVLMGNSSCAGVLGRRGVTRLRGLWQQAWGLPTLPMFHPAYLLRTPSAKREAWADLLSLRARLDDNS